MLEQLEAKPAGEAQIRVVQGNVLDHRALQPCGARHQSRGRTQAVHRDGFLEVAGRIHLALAQGQAGASPFGVSQKSPSSFLQTGHIVPGRVPKPRS